MVYNNIDTNDNVVIVMVVMVVVIKIVIIIVTSNSYHDCSMIMTELKMV